MKSSKGAVLCFVLGGLMLAAAGIAAYLLLSAGPEYELPFDTGVAFGIAGGCAALMTALFALGFLLAPKKTARPKPERRTRP